MSRRDEIIGELERLALLIQTCCSPDDQHPPSKENHLSQLLDTWTQLEQELENLPEPVSAPRLQYPRQNEEDPVLKYWIGLVYDGQNRKLAQKLQTYLSHRDIPPGFLRTFWTVVDAKFESRTRTRLFDAVLRDISSIIARDKDKFDDHLWLECSRMFDKRFPREKMGLDIAISKATKANLLQRREAQLLQFLRCTRNAMIHAPLPKIAYDTPIAKVEKRGPPRGQRGHPRGQRGHPQVTTTKDNFRPRLARREPTSVIRCGLCPQLGSICAYPDCRNYRCGVHMIELYDQEMVCELHRGSILECPHPHTEDMDGISQYFMEDDNPQECDLCEEPLCPCCALNNPDGCPVTPPVSSSDETVEESSEEIEESPEEEPEQPSNDPDELADEFENFNVTDILGYRNPSSRTLHKTDSCYKRDGTVYRPEYKDDGFRYCKRCYPKK